MTGEKMHAGMASALLAVAFVILAASAAWGQTPWPTGNGAAPYGATGPMPNVRGEPANMPYFPTRTPGDPVLPENWAAGRTSPLPPGPPPVAGAGTPADAQLCEDAQILARAGSDVVLTCELFSALEETVERNKSKVTPAEYELQRRQLFDTVHGGINELMAHAAEPNPSAGLDPQVRGLMQNLLRSQIETKLIYQDARRTIPTENMPNIELQLTREFDRVELKELMKREQVLSREELEWKLRAKGTSIERERRGFMQKAISQQWIHQKVKPDDEVTHEEMLQWYQTHLHEFEKPQRARWEELMVRTSKYPTPEAAYAAMVAMGNEVWSGRPLAEVAKARSDGPTASDGGQRDWTNLGAMASEEINGALFALPPGQLSRILQSKTGLHIVRVVEREPMTRTPFSEVQGKIRDKIRQERTKKLVDEYVAKLKKDFPVWTILDDPREKADMLSQGPGAAYR
jgi:hypothetical protein